MLFEGPKHKHLKCTIYRGVGGGGHAPTDSEIALLTQLEQSATAKAAEAAASALVAEGHADDAADSAAAAAASETASAASEAAAATSETNAAASEVAAALSETAAETAKDLAEDAQSAAEIAQAAAEDAQTAAETAQSLAEDAQAAAEAAQAAAEDIFTQFGDQYLGAFATDPTVDNSGNALTTGDIYFNTTDNVLKFYSGAAWVAPEDVATTAATAAAASATEAAGYADDASGFADDAAASAAEAATTLASKVSKTSDTGSAIVPTGTTAQRDGSPFSGFFRFNTDVAKFEGYNGTSWGSVGGGATGGGSDAVFVENDQVVTANYTIPATKNAMSTGPVTINSGVTVTVSSGARYVVL